MIMDNESGNDPQIIGNLSHNFPSRDDLGTSHPIIFSHILIRAVFKIPLSFHEILVGLVRDSPFLDDHNPQYMKGSIIPQPIIHQQGWRGHTAHARHRPQEPRPKEHITVWAASHSDDLACHGSLGLLEISPLLYRDNDKIGGFHGHGGYRDTQKVMVFVRENDIEMDDLGVPPFQTITMFIR